MAISAHSLKYMSLVVLCVQNSLLAVLMRLSRVGNYPKFNTSTAVLMGECLKMASCFFLIHSERKQQAQQTEKSKTESDKEKPSAWTVIFDQHELLRVSVPALLYVVQNNLQYVAVSNLDPATFQVLYQMKILTTAIFSVLMLRKSVLPLQWASLVVLALGVAMVQMNGSASSKSPKAGEMNMTLGLCAVLGACISSGFAGVYFEKILKKTNSKASLWERNVQLGIASILFAVGGLIWNDREFLRSYGFFYGYRPIVWAAISCSAFGGLMTAMVVKYADNILKGFATSLAIVLSVILSVFLFDSIPTFQFVIGAALVNGAVYLYGKAPSWNQQQQPTLLPHATTCCFKRKMAAGSTGTGTGTGTGPAHSQAKSKLINAPSSYPSVHSSTNLSSASNWPHFSPKALRYLSLAVLCLQNSVLVILVRLARTGHQKKFNASTAVLMSEFFKMAGCILVLTTQGNQRLSSSENAKKQDLDNAHAPVTSWNIIFDHKELLRISVPAGLYVVQNNLQYVAVSNLDPATFQVLYQLKILTTAIFSVVMLRKKVLLLQWVALCILTFGIALVQLDGQKVSSSQQKQAASGQKHHVVEMNMTLGLLAVLGVCVSSGFAGVYFEKILKKTNSKATLWERNVQMGITSIVFAVSGLLWNDREFLSTLGFFYGYRPIVWIAIATGAFGGLMTAVVVKYADNILKGFATSLAIVLSVILSVFLFDTIPSFQFVIGALLVNSSAYVYTKAPAWSQELVRPSSLSTTSRSSDQWHHPLTPSVASSPPSESMSMDKSSLQEGSGPEDQQPCSPRQRRPPSV